MASIILSTAGAAVGNSIPVVGPLIGGAIGRAVGGAVGGMIDDAVFGTPSYHREGARLADLSVQVSTYGKMIPLVYGTMRIAGNVIWSRPIKETATTTTSSSGGGKGGSSGGAKTTTTAYSYSVSLAIAVCEGEIQQVVRVWADAKQLDLSQGAYRIYKGNEEQLADPFIESFEGIGSTPAYRGISYVVIEDFPLEAFGNRIPNFTFEVKRPVKLPDFNGQAVEDMLTGMIMIPGAGEFVYDTVVQTKITGETVGGNFIESGTRQIVNMHTSEGRANAYVALDQLQETCPNLEWVAVVACWFGNAMDAASCVIKPGVEYQHTGTTTPDVWSVGGYTRNSAHQVTLVGGNPRYGGTPSDASMVRYLDELKARGYNILFLPMFFMDVDEKPWRGRVTGTASSVANFFTKTNGYNEFINHYATLVAGKVDAFSIGSELVGLNKVTDTPGNYPAVNQLVSLAATVRGIMGSGVKLTYAADWSEYHHTDGGWYHLDPLWASPNIDFVGIDAYFPLTDAPQNTFGYDVEAVMEGWGTGEGYDWIYTDPERTVQAALSPQYAWKNIVWWWNNVHTNPDASVTAWVPHMKKIWFTEYGFPSVDGATNQPNVFYDPTSSESFFPRHSRGRVDFRAQRLGITATEAFWQGSSMIEQKFLWTWDARPFPYFPDLLSVWSDGGVWVTGHWVTGKLGLSSLAAIVADLCARAGLDASRLDVSRLTQRVEGYVITRPASVRALLEELMDGFFFDAVESGDVLKFTVRGGSAAATIATTDMVRGEGAPLAMSRRQELELPREVHVMYLSRINLYQPGVQSSARSAGASQDVDTLNLPIVFADSEAQAVADVRLYLGWMARTRYAFSLPDSYAALEPTDIVELDDDGSVHTVRIVRTLRDRGRMQVEAIAEDVSVYEAGVSAIQAPGVALPPEPLGATHLEILDLPAFPADSQDDAYLRFAAVGELPRWRGAILYRSADNGDNYERFADALAPAILGTAVTALPAFAENRYDRASTLSVLLRGEGELHGTSELALLNGANTALLGNEIIQFKNVVQISDKKYEISFFLRGRLGTEWAVSSHALGERFVLLDGNVVKESLSHAAIGLPRLYKPVTVGATLATAEAQSFMYEGRALKPFSPVHVVGVRDLSGNIDVFWQRRTRVGGQWRDYVDAALGETQERYEVDIMDGSVVQRTLYCAVPAVTYGSAEQILDFGAPQSTLSVRIYQCSEAVGRGWPALAVL